MTVSSYGSTVAGFPRIHSDFAYAGTGATLDNSNLIQINWDNTTYDLTSREGKQRFFTALEVMFDNLMNAVERSGSTPV